MINILIADNQILIREGIRSLLSEYADLNVIAEVNNNVQLFTALKENLVDVVVIDFSSPDFFEISDIEKIYEQYPRSNILVVTSNQVKKDILKVLEYGVNNYILKECDKEEIISAIYATARRERFFCGKVIDVIFEKHFPKDKHCDPIPLSVREVEIVKLIAEGFTNRDIAKKLFLSVHTIGTHRKNIMKKLELKSPTELVLYAIKNDIVDPKETNS